LTLHRTRTCRSFFSNALSISKSPLNSHYRQPLPSPNDLCPHPFGAHHYSNRRQKHQDVTAF
jgi:hypothetical protein